MYIIGHEDQYGDIKWKKTGDWSRLFTALGGNLPPFAIGLSLYMFWNINVLDENFFYCVFKQTSQFLPN